jgi:hypothetical protein
VLRAALPVISLMSLATPYYHPYSNSNLQSPIPAHDLDDDGVRSSGFDWRLVLRARAMHGRHVCMGEQKKRYGKALGMDIRGKKWPWPRPAEANWNWRGVLETFCLPFSLSRLRRPGAMDRQLAPQGL